MKIIILTFVFFAFAGCTSSADKAAQEQMQKEQLQLAIKKIDIANRSVLKALISPKNRLTLPPGFKEVRFEFGCVASAKKTFARVNLQPQVGSVSLSLFESHQ